MKDPSVQLKEVGVFFHVLNLPQEELEALVATGKLVKVIRRAGEISFLPTGWAFCERELTRGPIDSYGLGGRPWPRRSSRSSARAKPLLISPSSPTTEYSCSGSGSGSSSGSGSGKNSGKNSVT